MKKLALVLVLGCCAGCVRAFPAVVSASDLSITCQKAAQAVNAKGKWDGKKADEIYDAGQCEGFIEGWIEGIDGAILTYNGNLAVVRIQRSKLQSMWSVADALATHLQKNPLDGGKPADEVLRNILLGSELISLSPYTAPASNAAPLQTNGIS